jgi:hypothetical protein
MLPDSDEVRYVNIVNLLKQMPKVDAPSNFESDLMRRINSGNFKERYKVKWWDKLFLPSRLIPASALVLSLFAVLYFLNFNSVEQENPFLVNSGIRKIVTQPSPNQLFPSKPSDYAEASVNSSFKINKEGLNFLQIRLNDAERAKINRLKEQIKAYFNQNQ